MKKSEAIPALPLSQTQLGIYREQLLCGNDMGAFQNSAFYDIQGPLDEGQYLQAIRLMLARHEQLRCILQVVGGQVGLYPLDADAIDVQFIDLSEKSSPREVALNACRRTQQLGYRELHDTPLSRFTLFRLGHNHHGLSLNCHQLLADAWAVVEQLNDINLCYEYRINSHERELPEPVSYTELSTQQQEYLQSERYEHDLQWLLDYYSVNTPRPLFPKVRAPHHIFASHSFERIIPVKRAGQLQEQCLRLGFSLTSLLFAVTHALFRHLSEDGLLHLQYVSLNRRGKRQKDIVGSFANVLAIEADWPLHTSLADNAVDCHRAARQLLRHMACPTGSVIPALHQKFGPEANFSGIAINHIPFRPAPILQGMQCSFYPMPFSSLNLFVEMDFLDMNDGQDKLLRLQCRKDIFSADEARHYLLSAEALLEQFLLDPAVTPLAFLDGRQSTLKILKEDQATTLSVTRGPDLPYPQDLTVDALLSDAMRHHSDVPAIIDPQAPQQQLDYRHYEQRANLVAEYLINAGVGRGDFVAVLLPRTLHLPVVLLGIMKTGAAYVPLDPSYPTDRIRFYLENSQAKICIVTDSTRALCETSEVRLVDIDGFDWNRLPTRIVADSRPEDPLYMIYTSGSTGLPKGVCLSHRNVLNYAYVVKEYPFIEQHDRVLWVAPIAFDMSVCDLYITALKGGCLVVAPAASVYNGRELVRLIDTYDINFMNATPATYRLLLDAGWQGRNNFHIIAGGEALTGELASHLLDRCSHVWNIYGPTETSVCVTYHEVTRRDTSTPTVRIGRPFDNVQLIVVDADLHIVPMGEQGELLIGGPGVGSGYWQRDDLTSERYVPLPEFGPGIFYRTGDLVFFNDDGSLQYLGRNDRQVKIRGFRIELDEIVRQLVQMDGVADAVVAGGDYRGRGTMLAAWIRPKDNDQLQENEVLEYLRQCLPHHTIPSLVRFVDHFPLTPAGKVDVGVLERSLTLNDTEVMQKKPQLPATAQAEVLATIWQEALGIGSVTMDDDFFALGGHSLTTFTVCSLVEEKLGIEIKPEQLMTYSRFADFSTYIGFLARNGA
ncbi:MAG: amino acid adenylation domain-containing protein [Desulfobulbus sp.]|nr:amino acid adenylation domain-containing protein [Desulfobulbus sp.]